MVLSENLLRNMLVSYKEELVNYNNMAYYDIECSGVKESIDYNNKVIDSINNILEGKETITFNKNVIDYFKAGNKLLDL